MHFFARSHEIGCCASAICYRVIFAAAMPCLLFTAPSSYDYIKILRYCGTLWSAVVRYGQRLLIANLSELYRTAHFAGLCRQVIRCIIIAWSMQLTNSSVAFSTDYSSPPMKLSQRCNLNADCETQLKATAKCDGGCLLHTHMSV